MLNEINRIARTLGLDIDAANMQASGALTEIVSVMAARLVELERRSSRMTDHADITAPQQHDDGKAPPGRPKARGILQRFSAGA